MKFYKLYKSSGYARWILPVFRVGDDIIYFYGFRPKNGDYKDVSIEIENKEEVAILFKEKNEIPMSEMKREEKINIIKFWFSHQNDINSYINQ